MFSCAFDRRFVLGAGVSLAAGLPALAQPMQPGFPVFVSAGPTAQPITVMARRHLVYELHLTGYATFPFELTRLEVLDERRGTLLSMEGEALRRTLLTVGAGGQAAPASSHPETVDVGKSLVAFLDVPLAQGAATPNRLDHRLTFTFKNRSGASAGATMTTAPVRVIGAPAITIASPLKGKGWVAFNAFGAMAHRRALLPVDGEPFIAQRFAIDWMQLADDGQLVHGDPKSNASFECYGAPVHAVAPGRIAMVTDDIPENLGLNETRTVPITVDTVTGNVVVQEIGSARFAVYAHLQPGRMRVKVGDRVAVGQVLGLLGNSGNSDAPHLHFHLIDRAAAIAGQGIPSVLASYSQTGLVSETDSDALLGGKAWHANGVPVRRLKEFPVDGAVCDFD